MTAPMLDGRRLTALEQKFITGYACGADIGAIAHATGRAQEYVGDILLQLCHLNRQQAQEIMRRGRTLPNVTPEVVAAAQIGNVRKAAADWSNGGSLLTPTEQHTLESLAAGYDCAAIARQFDLPHGTVRKRIYQLELRLGVAVGGDVVAAGVALGLITVAIPDPEPIVVVEPVAAPKPKTRRRKQTDADWWASLSRDEQNRVLQFVGPS